MQWFTYDTVDSTNEEAKRLFQQRAIREPLAVVVTESQTAGKGTQGRSWVSPPGAGLYFSIVHKPTWQRQHIPMTSDFTMAAGIACAETLKSYCCVNVRLKPINDLYLSGGKLGGILTESLIQQESIQCLITGIGINVREVDRPLADKRHTPSSLESALPVENFEALFMTDNGYHQLIDAIAESVNTIYDAFFFSPKYPLEHLHSAYHEWVGAASI
jgi:BirA family biotin operon repressor/biotin-[acetyl-CoA-carboxylase] ligase